MGMLESKTVNNWQIIIKSLMQNHELVDEKLPKPRRKLKRKTDFFYLGPCPIG